MGQVALNIGKDGATARTPQEIRDDLDAIMQGILPGFTSTLPKSLVEDMTSTATFSMVQCDQSYIDSINSISPAKSDLVILTDMVNAAGIAGQGQESRTSVYCVFSGVSGYTVPKGLIVADSVYQYEVQNGGVIGSGGVSEPLYCLATQDGSWAVPAGQVTSVVTSVPTGYTLTCNNPTDGIAGESSETVSEFRARALRSWTWTNKGTPTYLKELLYQISGVQQRLVSVKQQSSGLWSIICGGGDPYQIAEAIFTGLFDVSNLEGSATAARNITVNLYDYPDTYTMIFINPPVQTVSIAATWNTTSAYLVSNAAVQQLAAPALISYINTIPVGQPINDLTLAEVFKSAISSILNPELLTRLVFTVSINGSGANVQAGTHIYLSESESYFFAAPGSITVAQG